MRTKLALTANISKLGISGLLKVSTFNKNFNGLTVSGFEIPAYSYWQHVVGNSTIQKTGVNLES
jgi:hypothetical protein